MQWMTHPKRLNGESLPQTNHSPVCHERARNVIFTHKVVWSRKRRGGTTRSRLDAVRARLFVDVVDKKYTNDDNSLKLPGLH